MKENPSTKPASDALHTKSLNELLDTFYPPRAPIIDDLLYPGTYLFVGPPKIGKSFLMSQIAYHVATGMELWGHTVRKGTVLYLALEDDYARLQKRLAMMFGETGTDLLLMTIHSRTLGDGLIRQLEDFVKAHPDTKLIIIDTLQKIRQSQAEQYNYGSDYEVISQVKNFSDKNSVCVLLVHHTRKLDSSDSFEMISGTNGILGAADGAFVLTKKKRIDENAKLEVTGRDQPNMEITIRQDPVTCIWTLVKVEGERSPVPPDPLLKSIAEIVDTGEWCGSASRLAEQIPGHPKKANALSRYLNSHSVQLYKDFHISYRNEHGMDGSQIHLAYLHEEAALERTIPVFEEAFGQMEIPFEENSSEDPDNSPEAEPGTS